MTAYSRLQEKEFSREYQYGYEAVKHQRFVGTGYFDEVTQVIASGMSSTTALTGSTEAEQFAEMTEAGARGARAGCGMPTYPWRLSEYGAHSDRRCEFGGKIYRLSPYHNAALRPRRAAFLFQSLA